MIKFLEQTYLSNGEPELKAVPVQIAEENTAYLPPHCPLIRYELIPGQGQSLHLYEQKLRLSL
ncbi:hypothetical protein Ciccas_004925 [Cichlidogyrus casuarinus]|uniref:Uncharacterized protein n=1 Tax=Cichlidogyrus casuarinus TaxID=1844966 RepID=A0ABD2QAZ8_9PLAT